MTMRSIGWLCVAGAVNLALGVTVIGSGPVAGPLSSAARLLSTITFQRSGPPSVRDMLALRPTQRFVDYDTPPPEVASELKPDLVTEGKAKVWVLRDAGGRMYRRFVDSDRDGVVDQWIYYQNGVEVYRDIDSNSNGRADQFRWLNGGGCRWAFDNNEDGRIDGYRWLSVEEATREVVRALALKDFSIVEPTLARQGDLPSLGKTVTADQLRDSVARSRERFNSLTEQLSSLTSESQWVKFECGIPMLVPGDAADGSRDIVLYRNANAVIQTGQHVDVLQFGLVVLVGRTAKIIEMPEVVTPKTPTLAAGNAAYNNVPAEIPTTPDKPADSESQEFLSQLLKLDEAAAKGESNNASMASYHLKRAELLAKLAELAKGRDDKLEWMKQRADSLIAALQASEDKEVQDRVQEFLEIARGEGESGLASYVAFRCISADYFRKMQAQGSDFTSIQTEWLSRLERFVEEFPKSEDAPEALSQLAIGLEFTGKEDRARESYQKLVDAFPDSAAAPRARGSLERLNSLGKTLSLRAPELRRGTVDVKQLRGKVVLVDYWSTSCEPWKTELARLKEIYAKYHGKGFEIVSVSLDTNKSEVLKFVQQNGITWPVVFEGGGLESPAAVAYGILALPTQILVNPKGEVANRTVHVTQLEEEIQKLLEK